ncbi:MAG: Uncharacterized protein AWU57_598 [Marinobacter sp. T13-3]|nr:MAG: Uncharacterized protein AWU57_598 [Marinobacter sp. T13-3]
MPFEPNWTIHPSLNAIEQARANLDARIAADKANGVPHFDSAEAVTDPAITVFLDAMRIDGLPPKLRPSGCLEIAVCRRCQGFSLFTFQGHNTDAFDKGLFQLCGHCDLPADMRTS